VAQFFFDSQCRFVHFSPQFFSFCECHSHHCSAMWRDWSLVYDCISTTWSTVCHWQTSDADCTQNTSTETLEQLTWRWKAARTIHPDSHSCVMQQNQIKIELCWDRNKNSHLSPKTEVILWPRSVDRSQYLKSRVEIRVQVDCVWLLSEQRPIEL